MRLFPRRRLRTPHLAKRRRNILIFRCALAIVFVFSLVLGLSTLSEMDRILITSVKTQGNSVVTAKELITLAEESLSGRYFWLFPKKNSFIYPKRSIKAGVLDVFERVEEIEIKRDGPKGIKMLIKEYSPDSLWCGDVIGESEQCYFMNNNGLIYGIAPFFSGNAFFRFYGSGVKRNPVGDTFLPNEFEKYVFFTEMLRSINLEPIYLSILDETDFEVGFEDESRILVARESDLSQIVENLRSIIESEDFSNDKVVDYIDLRFGNKIYYKLK